MKLQGSCHCGAVRFSMVSHTPQPYMRCYCSICRKTQGGGGYAINIMGEAPTLKVAGHRSIAVYRARLPGPGRRSRLSGARRHFCRKCGSALWVSDPEWPQWVYPFASAIDSKLPVPPEREHVMLEFAAPWVEVPRGRHDRRFTGYPRDSIEDWHKKRGLYGKGRVARGRRRATAS